MAKRKNIQELFNQWQRIASASPERGKKAEAIYQRYADNILHKSKKVAPKYKEYESRLEKSSKDMTLDEMRNNSRIVGNLAQAINQTKVPRSQYMGLNHG